MSVGLCRFARRRQDVKPSLSRLTAPQALYTVAELREIPWISGRLAQLKGRSRELPDRAASSPGRFLGSETESSRFLTTRPHQLRNDYA